MLLPACLTLHLTALTLMAGTTVVDYITFKSFWKLFYKEKEKAIGVMQVMATFSRLIGIGAAVLILTGIGMMALTNGVFGEQLWFRIKFGLVIILILNGAFVGRRQGVKLRKLINSEPGSPDQVNAIRANLNKFYLIQLSIFFIIILLSAFKFN
ncbi:MAG: hypothetical protein JWR23_2883 [Mucilaginibacter sp.]|nr:hypothetical protein [Mucilaginibacter sp.]